MKLSLWMTQELDPNDSCDHEVVCRVRFGADTINDGPGGPNLPEVIVEDAVYWSESQKAYLPYPLNEEEFERVVEEAIHNLTYFPK